MSLIKWIYNINRQYNYKLSFFFILFFVVLISIIIIIYHLRIFHRKSQLIYYKEELFNSLCSRIDDVFIIYNLEKHIIEYCSPNSERTLGINCKILRKNPTIILGYIKKEFKEEIIKQYTNNITTNYEVEFEYSHPVNNKTYSFMLRIYPVLSHNAVIRYISSISDQTKLKQSQQILKDALLSAQKANEAKKDFLSHMSHEIKTPIHIITGMTDIASKSLDNQEKLNNCLGKIMKASNNLLAVVNNILDMVKIDSSKLLLTIEPFNLNHFLKDYGSVIYSQAELNQLNFKLITTEFSDEYLLGDTLRLTQILNNCIFNSIKFTPPSGTIKLQVAEIEKCNQRRLFRFIISDNGKGMSKEYLGRIFIPFEQEDCYIAKKYGGSGLGMSITKNLVTLMGGSIFITSKLGKGTTITIDLSFNIPDNLLPKDSPAEKKLLQDYDFSGHRILAVEDNEINLEIICEFLKFIHVQVDTATNGRDALDMFEKATPSYYEIILMDIQMPGLNGYETAKLIRSSKHPDASKICIIAMSADSYADDIAYSLEAGMNYHLAKPIDINIFNILLKEIFTKS